MYMDIPVDYVANDVVVFVTNLTGSGRSFLRRDGFADSTINAGYETTKQIQSLPSMFIINQYEYAVAGRIYVGIQYQMSNRELCV